MAHSYIIPEKHGLSLDPEGNRPLQTGRGVDGKIIIKMNHGETGLESVGGRT